MKKAFLLSGFFILSPIVLILSLLLLSSSFQKNSFSLFFSSPKVAYAALPPASGTLKVAIQKEDARLSLVRDFFSNYKSELLPYAKDVIKAADTYGLDYRLVPAIAMQESNLCKKAPKNSHNCWGFGIYGKKITRFDNYKDAINTVTKTLAQKYKAQGLNTPEEIMSRYTPSSNGSWAFSVNHFMKELSI